MEEEKIQALEQLCTEEELDPQQFQALIDTYIFSGREPIAEEIVRCLGSRPSVLRARAISERILEKMKRFVEIFAVGLAA